MKEITILACTSPECKEKVEKSLRAMGMVTDHKFKELEKRVEALEDKAST